ncbi:hypothetical protein Cob_v012861 [Colletotrichum orbiculare MAFF 240422]|uniref:Uncharacterized protein n=1 Tax=Colletotrichum orbiculare (strain 104-T / ATCC 96160 / CBS 514.97 / LARS 414 / MAFF 240422) TaxID=1213857 RepID=A0A484F7U0_COLOR|nr:hypothetical protein Cob_v012861 [Colletotrichum orbiculare MAFF 240422]
MVFDSLDSGNTQPRLPGITAIFESSAPADSHICRDLRMTPVNSASRTARDRVHGVQVGPLLPTTTRVSRLYHIQR